METEKATTLKIFYCYAKEDGALREEIEKHLSPLRRLKQVTGWYDRKILAGANWEHEIQMHLNEAHLILLLISPDFISTDYCYSVEMQRAIERHKAGRAQVIPIILRPVLWEETPIGELQVLPINRRPITQWPDRDSAFLHIAQEISKAVKLLLSKEVLSQQETRIIEQLGRKAGFQYIGTLETHLRDQSPPSIKKVLSEVKTPQRVVQQHPTNEGIRATGDLDGRLIQERYSLKNLIKQGQTSAIYYGWDEVLSRDVAVKIVSAPHIAVYRAAIRLTSHFSHPNIVSLYDLVLETDSLYVVQEYIEGEDFAALMQKRLTPFAVLDIGCQICRALIYAGSSSRRISHGDLVPSSIMYDRNGFVRVNNFALPSDTGYFQRWKGMGGDGPLFSEVELPWGTWSEERQADDTRAVGLLLYQLLAGRTPGTNIVEPRSDGRMGFQRNVPPEVCETVARAVARQHPSYIRTPEALFGELKTLADGLEPALPAVAPTTTELNTPVVATSSSAVADISLKLDTDSQTSSGGSTNIGRRAWWKPSRAK